MPGAGPSYGARVLGNGRHAWAAIDCTTRGQAGRPLPLGLHWRLGGVAGRMYVLGVVLGPGDTRTIAVTPDDYSPSASFPPGPVELQRRFTGRPSNEAEWPRTWVGSAVSAPVEFEITNERQCPERASIQMRRTRRVSPAGARVTWRRWADKMHQPSVVAIVALTMAASARPIGGALFQPTLDRAADLVQSLGAFSPALPATPLRGDRLIVEERRRAVYARLWELGAAAMPALIGGLTDANAGVRQNVALFLGAASGNCYEPERPRLDIRPCLPTLIRALDDSDSRVRGLSAHAVANLGSAAAVAVPALTRLLSAPSEGNRLSACAALGAIGPAARESLPTLRVAETDPSPLVGRCATGAIARIER